MIRILDNNDTHFKNEIIKYIPDAIFVSDNSGVDFVMQPNTKKCYISNKYTDILYFHNKLMSLDKFNVLQNLKLNSRQYDTIKMVPFTYFSASETYTHFKNMYNDKIFQLIESNNNIETILDEGTLDYLKDKFNTKFKLNNYSNFVFDNNNKIFVKLKIGAAKVLYCAKLYENTEKIYHTFFSEILSDDLKKFIDNFICEYNIFCKILYYEEYGKVVIYDIINGIYPEHLTVLSNEKYNELLKTLSYITEIKNNYIQYNSEDL